MSTDGGRQGLSGAVALLTLVRIGSVGAGFLASVIGAHLIGAEGLGVVGAATTLATIAALAANGGINIAAVYFLGQRPLQAREIVGWVATMGVGASILAAGVAIGLGTLLGSRIFGEIGVGVVGATAALAAGILAFELGLSLIHI